MKQIQTKTVATIMLLTTALYANIPSINTKQFNINTQGNTDLIGAKIVSTQPSTLTTGTLTYSDIENKTEYSNIGFGSSGLDSPMAGDKQTQTNTAISNNITVDIKDKAKQTQDISKISNDTEHAHYRVQEVNKEVLNIRKDVAGQVGATAFTYVAHTLYENDNIKDSLPPKTLVHGIIGGVVSKIAGGEFKTGATEAVVAHEVAKKVIETKLERLLDGEDISKEEIQADAKLVSTITNLIVSGATGGNLNDMASSASVGNSVVENNDLKGFDAKYNFIKGIGVGAKDEAIDMIKAIGGSITSPIDTVNALTKFLTSPEAIKNMTIDEIQTIQNKLIHINAALFSDTTFQGEEALNAGKDAGELLLFVASISGGVKGVSAIVKASKKSKINSDILQSPNKIEKDYKGKVISRKPKSIQDRMTLDAAKRGEGKKKWI